MGKEWKGGEAEGGRGERQKTLAPEETDVGRRWLAQSSVSLAAGCLVTSKKHYLQWQGAHSGEELSGMEGCDSR